MKALFFAFTLLLAASNCHESRMPTEATDAGFTPSTDANPATAAGLPSFVDLFTQASPSVVNISAAHPLPIPENLLARRERELWRALVRSLGSGFVFDREGHVVTCSSVVQDAEDIEVILHNGRHLKAQVVASDEISDIAVLSIPADQSPPPLPLARAGGIRPGQWVAAFGYPYGLSHTITAGIVSTVRSASELHSSHGLILSDAAINPGCNGGPLLDTHGQVVGINLITGQTEGSLGLAIPMEDALPLLDLLKTGKHPPLPWLGVAVQPVDAALAKSFGLPSMEGALVTRLVEGGPGDRAGVHPGDVVVSFAHRPVPDPLSLIESVKKAAVGKPLPLVVIRLGQKKALTVTLRQSP